MTPEWMMQLCRDLGYDPKTVSEIRLLPDHLEVAFYLTNENGAKYAVTDSTGQRVPAMEVRRHSYDEVPV